MNEIESKKENPEIENECLQAHIESENLLLSPVEGKSQFIVPIWNFITYFPIDELSNDLNLNIEVKDHNPIRSHKNLGKISLSVSEIALKRHINNEWRKLDDVDTGEIGKEKIG